MLYSWDPEGRQEVLSVNDKGEGFLTCSSNVFISIAQTDTQEGGSSRRHGTSMVSSASMGILHSSSLHDYTPVSRSENQDSLQVSPLTSSPFSLFYLPSSSLLFCVILSLQNFLILQQERENPGQQITHSHQ